MHYYYVSRWQVGPSHYIKQLRYVPTSWWIDGIICTEFSSSWTEAYFYLGASRYIPSLANSGHLLPISQRKYAMSLSYVHLHWPKREACGTCNRKSTYFTFSKGVTMDMLHSWWHHVYQWNSLGKILVSDCTRNLCQGYSNITQKSCLIVLSV